MLNNILSYNILEHSAEEINDLLTFLFIGNDTNGDLYLAKDKDNKFVWKQLPYLTGPETE